MGPAAAETTGSTSASLDAKLAELKVKRERFSASSLDVAKGTGFVRFTGAEVRRAPLMSPVWF